MPGLNERASTSAPFPEGVFDNEAKATSIPYLMPSSGVIEASSKVETIAAATIGRRIIASAHLAHPE